MKRYRTIVTGKNDLIIDDFFLQMGDVFEVMSCSGRYNDRFRHIELLNPAIFVICLNDETVEEMLGVLELKRILTSKDVKTVVIGKEDECEIFQKHVAQVVDLVLTRPISADVIKDSILKMMEEAEKEKEEMDAAMLKELEELKKKQEKKHVLVVDDDPIMQKVIKEYIGDQYTVATAINGRVARKFLTTKETNLILLDYEMPGEDGVEVLKKIRKDSKLDKIPVVFLTGVTERSKLMDALVLKPQGYLLKPIDREKLLGTIEKFIG